MTDGHRCDSPAGRRCALLVDGAHLRDCLIELRRDIDFRKLLTFLPEHGVVTRAVYFCSPESDAGPYLTKLADWLSYNGYDVECSLSGRKGRHTSRDRVSIAVRAIALARHFDTLPMIIGGDEYKPLVSGIQWMGPRVVVISTRHGSPPRVGDALRRQADDFVELSDLLPRVARGPAAPAKTVP